MHIRRLGGVLVVAGLLLMPAGRADALTAGTGTAMVTVIANPLSPGSSTLTISATFDDNTYDLGVNLGPLGKLSATSVALTNVNLGQGAHFDIPFTDTTPPITTNAFHAVGDIACPADGCISPTPTERYGFVGFLQSVSVSLLPAGNVYTFDGSVSCTLAGITLTCTGPFVLNAFPADDVTIGSPPPIDRTVTFTDPSTTPPSVRSFDARVILDGVTTGGMLSITGISRYRGSIPAGYSLSSGGFAAFFFDVATDAVFGPGATRRVCVEVDTNLDGIVDDTSLTITQLASLHATTPGNPFAAVPLMYVPPFICADILSFSPFVLLVDTTPPASTTTTSTLVTTTSTLGTTTTSIPGGTTTTIATPSSTSTTLPPACATARDCLTAATSKPLCDPIDSKLQNTISKKTAVAATKLGKAAAATGAKAARFQKQAKAAINAILTKAGKFAKRKKNPISSTCADAIQKVLQPVIGAIDASKI